MVDKKKTAIVVAQDQSKLAPLNTSHITPELFKDMPGYQETIEQAPNTIDLMVREAKHLLTLEDKVNMERGKLLIELRSKLKSSRQWKFWLDIVGYDDATARRHIDHYVMMQEMPEVIAKVVRERGYILVKRRVELRPPPKNPTVAQAIKWVQEQMTPNFHRDVIGPLDEKELAVLGATGLRQLVERAEASGLSPKEKRKMAEHLGGVLLGLVGIQSPMTIQPVALPEEAKPKPRGAPRGPRKPKQLTGGK